MIQEKDDNESGMNKRGGEKKQKASREGCLCWPAAAVDREPAEVYWMSVISRSPVTLPS